jgi:hypothetical protein
MRRPWPTEGLLGKKKKKLINWTKLLTTPIHVVFEYSTVLQIKPCTEELTDITDLHSK